MKQSMTDYREIRVIESYIEHQCRILIKHLKQVKIGILNKQYWDQTMQQH